MLSVRLTPEEHAHLMVEAGGQSLSAYVRAKLLDGEAQKRKIRGKTATKNHQALGRVLALLGSSNIAANLSALAKAAKNGALPVSTETEAAITKACTDIHTMRNTLMRALGFRP